MPTERKKEIHYSHKRAMKRRVTYVLVGVAALYFFAIFPLSAAAAVLGHAEPQTWAAVGIRLGGTATAVALLSFVLFASDSAFRGSNETARWIRKRFALHAAVEKFACTEAEASELWFKYFDTWALEGSPHRHLLYVTYDSTYAARMVFYLVRALQAFALLTTATMIAQALIFGSYAGEEGTRLVLVHGAVLLAYVAAAVFVSASNRLGDQHTEPTGCWARVNEVFERSAVAFRHDILNAATSLGDAFATVERLRTQYRGPAGN